MQRTALLLATLLATLPLRAEPTANERFTTAIQKIIAVFDAGAKERKTLRTTLEVLSGEGLPQELRNAKLDIALSAPDRLQITTFYFANTIGHPKTKSL